MTRITEKATLIRAESSTPVVYIVDDEPDIRAAITMVLRADGFETRSFQSGNAFLEHCHPGMRGCLLLDLCLPDSSGLDVQKHLADRGIRLPILFLTGHGTIGSAAEAFRTGAFDYLEKPFDNEILRQRVANALAEDAKRSIADENRSTVAARYARLSDREKEVLRFIVDGYSSKEMAQRMGISHRTVEIYRGHLMQKMRTETLVELMRLVTPLIAELGLSEPSD